MAAVKAPVRHFAGNGTVKVSEGNNNTFEAITFAFLVYPENVEAGAHESLITSYTSAEAVKGYSAEFENKQIGMENGPAEWGTTPEFANNKWALIVLSKGAGTVKVKSMVYAYTGSPAWAEHESSGTLANAEAPGSTGIITLGSEKAGEYFKGNVAAIARWSVQLSKAEAEALGTARCLHDWRLTSPTGLWLFNQAATTESVLDLTGGGANQTSVTNTSVVEEEIPIPYFTHDLSASGGGG